LEGRSIFMRIFTPQSSRRSPADRSNSPSKFNGRRDSSNSRVLVLIILTGDVECLRDRGRAGGAAEVEVEPGMRPDSWGLAPLRTVAGELDIVERAEVSKVFDALVPAALVLEALWPLHSVRKIERRLLLVYGFTATSTAA